MTEPDVMLQMIKEWKAQHREKPRDLDFDMFCQVLNIVNEESPVKVACNPLDDDHDWIPETACYNVSKIEVDDQGRLVLSMRRDKQELSAERMHEAINRLKRHKPAKTSAVMLRVSETKVVQLTDVYSHALVKDSWAGLPFDVVFAYYESTAE